MRRGPALAQRPVQAHPSPPTGVDLPITPATRLATGDSKWGHRRIHSELTRLAIGDVNPEDYDVLVIPGGRAPEYIRTDPDVAHIVKHFFDRALPVGTICHGPQVPAALGLLHGRTTAAYPPLKADVGNAGATFVDGAMVSAAAARPARVVARVHAGAGQGERPGLTYVH
ncbi:DJ-1/PfpI family protein [Kibdelosporangium aridum]|uniref:DJ-1/PfpI family protein n=1 Tax=Kibdelosporangium aridum TaxID=2030 RepID=UPI00068F51EC|nr:DJ-1/PfpI family protein [Kibdelosporangium aridum]